MNDPTLPLTIVLLFVTSVMIILYYRQISKVNEECEEAEDVMSDITIGFSRKMKKQDARISLVAETVEGLTSEEENLLRKMNSHERRLADIASKAEKTLQSRSKIMTELEVIEERIAKAVSTQETIKQKIDKLKKARSEAAIRPKRKIKTPISIERKTVLAPLTDYQVKILEILATEGEKTAPEMKDKIGITREHTARLMKRLCDEGYVERDRRSLRAHTSLRARAYVYRIKEEAREILGKG